MPKNTNIRDAFVSGLIGAIICFALSFLANYFVVPFPKSPLANGFNNGISGLISGFMSGFMGLFMYLKSK